MNPPHSRDLNQPGDAVYNRAATIASIRPGDVEYQNIPESVSSDVDPQQPRTNSRDGTTFVPASSFNLEGLGGVDLGGVDLGGVGLGTERQTASGLGATQNSSIHIQSAPVFCTPALNYTPPRATSLGRRTASTPATNLVPLKHDDPVNLSSSEASFVDLIRKYGNTGQRRKSLSGHKQIAQAT
jgi:hypothetical protein